MSTKIYVGKLSYDTTEKQVQELFSEHGAVKSTMLIKDRDTGQSKGFAFVEMEDDAEAHKAIAALNNKELDGRTILVNVAKPREDR